MYVRRGLLSRPYRGYAISHQAVLPRMTAYWRAEDYSGSGALLDGKGVHHAQLGSTAGADTNDPLWLPYAGVQHLYVPGVAANYASTPYTGFASISTGTVTVRARIRARDYTPAAVLGILGETSSRLRFELQTTGVLQFNYVDAGGTTRTVVSTVAVPSVVDNTTDVWVEATHDLDADTVTFRYSLTDTNDPTAVSWSAVGTAVAITDGTYNAAFGSLVAGSRNGATIPFDGRIYVAQWLRNGTTVASPDFTDTALVAAPFQTFTDAQGNLWTINRSTTGLKAEIVNSSRFALGTDDYLEVADHADLKPGSGPFTFACLVRVYNATPPAFETFASKLVTGGFRMDRTAQNRLNVVINDGTTSGSSAAQTEIPRGSDVLLAMVRDATHLRGYVDGVEVAAAVATGVGSIDNTEPLRFGRRSGAGTNYVNDTMRGTAWYKGVALSPHHLLRVKRELERVL